MILTYKTQNSVYLIDKDNKKFKILKSKNPDINTEIHHGDWIPYLDISIENNIAIHYINPINGNNRILSSTDIII